MPERVFLVGAPRSGTTWLQRMLGLHPAVATSQETDLVDGYLAPWQALWERHLPAEPDRWRQQRYKGLPAVMTEEAFDRVLRSMLDLVHGETLRLKPTARVLLEKVPGYSLQGPLILRLAPDARFVHLVRDGRDVAASLRRASRGWGSFWAPASAERAALTWREHVEGARSIAGLTDRYVEVRYEDLVLGDAAGIVAELLRFCGVETDALDAGELVARANAGADSLVWGGEVARRLSTEPREPAGFAGEGGVGAWRRDLGLRDRLLVEAAAGGLLRNLGYADGPRWIGAGVVRRAAARAGIRAEKRLRAMRGRAVSWAGAR